MVTGIELQEAVGRGRWTISRWNRLGAFGELSWPGRENQPRGRRIFKAAHIDRAKFILACTEAGIAVSAIGRLDPHTWAEAGAIDKPRGAWTAEKLRGLVEVADALEEGTTLRQLASRRARARKRSKR